MPTIEIDGRTLEIEPGTMIIEAADAAGIYIPRFCYHRKLSIAANCRMCLVEVEKAPKPLPACATPIVDGMKVFTRSALAVDAQKSTMEFLLINHPLDCPICDQGGECPLQDQALGYGKDVSRYSETKRVVEDHDIGPLIETEMTRCIHCTRCVRFGQEVAGVMELGATGRTENMSIATFVGQTVDSELSGNMIDLCPVGALTSKPYRYTARAWELSSHDGVSPHDCVGANVRIQSLRMRVKRVLPVENEDVNESWLADRDRFSYEAVNSDDRLVAPMLRQNGEWREVDWRTALGYTAERLRETLAGHGATSLGALAGPGSTLEEFYLLQKLMRALGSGNVDHRLRQADFSDDDVAPRRPGLGMAIRDIERQRAVLLVGSNLRKEQPLLGVRVRKAFVGGARVMAVNPLDYDFNFALAHKRIVAPSAMPRSLAAVAAALATLTRRPLPDAMADWLGGVEPDATERAMAQELNEAGAQGLVVGGPSVAGHPQGAALRAMIEWIAATCGAHWGLLPDGNGAAGWLAGCVPHRGAGGTAAELTGKTVAAMLAEPLRAYVLLGVEPGLDCLAGAAAGEAMRGADFVVRLAAFRDDAEDHADVLLPIATFAETPGTYVNCEGRVQTVSGALPCAGEARPAWKVLRVLGNALERTGFDYVTCDDVRAEVALGQPPGAPGLESWRLASPPAASNDGDGELERIADVPIYAVDPVVRRAPALQATADAAPAAARLSPAQAAALGLTAGVMVEARMGGRCVTLPTVLDPRVPDGCVHIASGQAETVGLDGPGRVRLVRA